MRVIFIAFISIFFIMNASSQETIVDRNPYAAGRFYPADKGSLQKDLASLFMESRKPEGKDRVRAIICPHAGYVFSGKTAASAFSAIPRNASYKNIFIIGSSHVMSFDGASVYDEGDYVTPLGKAVVNREIAAELKKNSKVFNFPVTAHAKEHSIEVQVPFIQYYFNNTPPIVPIILGTNSSKTVKQVAEALKPWFTEDNLFIISSDFSHYPSYKDAVEYDRLTATSIKSGKPSVFLRTLDENSGKGIKGLLTSMCGWTSGLTLLYLAEGNDNLVFNIVDYSNSGDSPYGNKDEVVGYNAITLTEKPARPVNMEELRFTESEKSLLFRYARNSVLSRLENKPPEPDPDRKLPPVFNEHLGAFVTLKINGMLRGCIGRFASDEPLYKVVKESAVSSAFGDPRFPQLSEEEYPRTEFEITVLGSMKKISDINEIKLGRHGIYIKKGNKAGTMLPQVAIENHWTLEQFLGYTSRDKAGLGWDGWKNADIYIYEGVVLEENK
jgi:AmmeMemoRadiSam system protein B/AmmeMemoRadiSam system protein A